MGCYLLIVNSCQNILLYEDIFLGKSAKTTIHLRIYICLHVFELCIVCFHFYQIAKASPAYVLMMSICQSVRSLIFANTVKLI